MTARDLCTEVLEDLGVTSQGETPSAADLDVVLKKLTRLVDTWNAIREAIYADQLLPFTLTPALQPHTIGPTGATWTTAQRPVSVEGAELTLSSASRLPITMRSAEWYATLTSPTLTSTQPVDLYYAPTWPNGSLYFWPIPSAAYTVTLRIRSILSTYTLATTFTMPPGYRDSMTLTLMEMCASSFGLEVTPDTHRLATQARAQIFTNNRPIPGMSAAPGTPGRALSWFDYLVGQ